MKRKCLKIFVFLILMIFVGSNNILAESTGPLIRGSWLYYKLENGNYIFNKATTGSGNVPPGIYYKYTDNGGEYMCATGFEVPITESIDCPVTPNNNSIGVGYLINEISNNNNIKGLSNEEQYYLKEIVELKYLDKWGNNGVDALNQLVKEKLGVEVDSLVNNANTYNSKYSQEKYSKDVNIDLTENSLQFTEGNDGYYYSQKVYIKDVNSNSDNISVQINNSDFTLIENTDESGRYFQVKIEKTKVVGKALSVSVSVKGNYSYVDSTYYDCATGQDLFSTKIKYINNEDSATISGEIAETQLIIKKIDENGNLLPGATIRISNDDGTYSKEIKTTDKEIVLQDLKYGKYTIKEISSPEGYVVEVGSYTVNLNQNNLIQTIIIKNILTKVEFSKTDENGNLLPGAVLQIQNKEGNVISDKNGDPYEWKTTTETYTITGLLPGTYYLAEIISPDGYVLNSKREEFIVDGKESLVKVKMTNELNKVIISKINITTKKELPGAMLEIQDKDGNIVKLCTDKEDNKNTECKWESTDKPYEIEGMPKGTYYLVETKVPEGFALNKEKVKFVVDEKKSVIEVTMENQLNKVKISKISVATKSELPGAKLEIQDKDGNIVKLCLDKEGNKNTECKWESTDKPYEIEGMPKGTYYLVETLAPEGYVLNEEKVKFTITDKDLVVEVKMENELEVKVPDTLSSRSSLLIAISMFDIALGIGIVTYVKKNKIEE